VGTFSNGGRAFSLDDEIGIPRPTPIVASSVDEVMAMVCGTESVLPLDYRFCQGIISFDSNGEPSKVYTEQYAYFRGLRGNVASIWARYLQLRSANGGISVADTEPSRNFQAFLQLYAEHMPVFIQYEEYINRLVVQLFAQYKERFMEKSESPPKMYPSDVWAVLNACHAWYRNEKMTRGRKVVTEAVVRDVLSRQDGVRLNKLIRGLKRTDKLSLQEAICVKLKKRVEELKNELKKDCTDDDAIEGFVAQILDVEMTEEEAKIWAKMTRTELVEPEED
jgi:hypothetical protein